MFFQLKLSKLSDKIIIKGGAKLKYRLEEIFKKYNIFKYVSYMLILVAVVVIIIAFLPVRSNTTSTYSPGGVILRNANSDMIETSINETNSALISVKTFSKNGYPIINQLVGKYYDALMANDDTKLSKYTDSVENIDPLKRIINSQYIESYQSLDCYTMTGIIEGTYIVVALYQVKYKNISTVTSYLDYFYVCTDLSDNVYITNKAVSDEVSAYNQLMYENNTIKGLEQLVANEYDTALKSDEQLAGFVKNLQQ